MAFISTEMNIILKTIDVNDDDECLGCETGVEYIGAHLNETGRYHKHCCTREASQERKLLSNI